VPLNVTGPLLEGVLPPQAPTSIVAAIKRASQKSGLTMRGTNFIPPLLVGGTSSRNHAPVPPATTLW